MPEQPNLGECWTWPRAVSSSGYGSVWVDGSNKLAHKAIWEAIYGPVPDGLELDHLCENKKCVRIDHLEAVTHQENIRRHHAKNPKTHCQVGHEFTPENTITKKDGRRRCLICTRAYDRKWKQVRRDDAKRAA